MAAQGVRGLQVVFKSIQSQFKQISEMFQSVSRRTSIYLQKQNTASFPDKTWGWFRKKPSNLQHLNCKSHPPTPGCADDLELSFENGMGVTPTNTVQFTSNLTPCKHLRCLWNRLCLETEPQKKWAEKHIFHPVQLYRSNFIDGQGEQIDLEYRLEY